MKHFYLFLSLVFLFTGCSQKEIKVKIKDYNLTKKNTQESTKIADLEEFPQDAKFYVNNIYVHSQLLDIQKHYDKLYFSPWEYKTPPISEYDALWPYRTYKYKKSYGENLQPIPKEWFAKMAREGNFDKYGTINKKAISLHYVSLRNFPTKKPLFRDPSKAGEGFPFDYLQNSGVFANEPLFVSHLSKDGEWAYLFSSYASGWVPLRDISFLNEKVTQTWKEARQVKITSESFPIKSIDGKFLFKGRVGMQLPLIEIKQDHYVALAVSGGRDNNPIYNKVKIPFNIGREKIMKLNSQNFVYIINLMLHNSYGWGGLYEDRDCSSTIRDLFASFNIWLPRNSAQQAKIGEVISLENISLEKKRELIIQKAVPFETLLHIKGHILLYLGLYKNKIAVLHNVWGVKTVKNGKDGRSIIGKTIISSLELGKNQQGYELSHSSLLFKIDSMNIITKQTK